MMHLTLRGERGLVLVISLLVLLVLGVIASAVLRTNTLQLRMAGNTEAKTAARLSALAVIDAVVAVPENFHESVLPGTRLCLRDSVYESCVSEQLALASSYVIPLGAQAAVLRRGPAVSRLPVQSEDAASSAVHYRVAKFEVEVTVQRLAEQGARVELKQGIALRIPSSPRLAGDEW